jgi:leucyl/phenylalanyl-tRNA---protein transferase
MVNRSHPSSSMPIWAEYAEQLPYHTHIIRGAAHIDSIYAISMQLDAHWIRTAYSRGLFPWYNEGEPVLWHSPNPRMVLDVSHFKCALSLRKKIRQWQKINAAHLHNHTHAQNILPYRITFNQAFEQVIDACAHAQRKDQSGTWINPTLQKAYCELFSQQNALSVELWQNGVLVSGLYGVLIGRMFFGESMFTHISDGSKIALTAWVHYFQANGGQWIDCQQVTAHLTRLGAHPITRRTFFKHSRHLMRMPAMNWTDFQHVENALDWL